ncbi:hypothetical protein Dimus_035152 [Dionaea muscipula]
MEAERRHDRAEMEAEQLDHVKGVEKDPRVFIRVDYVPSDLIRSKGCDYIISINGDLKLGNKLGDLAGAGGLRVGIAPKRVGYPGSCYR